MRWATVGRGHPARREQLHVWNMEDPLQASNRAGGRCTCARIPGDHVPLPRVRKSSSAGFGMWRWRPEQRGECAELVRGRMSHNEADQPWSVSVGDSIGVSYVGRLRVEGARRIEAGKAGKARAMTRPTRRTSCRGAMDSTAGLGKAQHGGVERQGEGRCSSDLHGFFTNPDYLGSNQFEGIGRR